MSCKLNLKTTRQLLLHCPNCAHPCACTHSDTVTAFLARDGLMPRTQGCVRAAPRLRSRRFKIGLNSVLQNRQAGFSLPVAIFILVIMALIGTALANLIQSSHTALGQEVLSTRAFYAAESGAQYALGQLFPLNGGAANCASPYPVINYNAADLSGCSASTGSCLFGTTSATRQIELMAKSP
jgi:hypothetical protein